MATFLSKDDPFLSSVEKTYIQLLDDVLHKQKMAGLSFFVKPFFIGQYYHMV